MNNSRMKGMMLWALLCVLAIGSVTGQPAAPREYYQLTVYHFKDAAQEAILDDYLERALMPALHGMNMKNIGVFKNMANDTVADKTIYVLMPVRSLADVEAVGDKLAANSAYRAAGSRYLDAAWDSAPYTRMENILMHAFELAPQLQQPQLKGAKQNRVYELRSYEGATEKLYRSKVKMFNAGDEIGIFKNLNFNAVFYAEVLAGSRMPNLMYMTTFENMAERDARWKDFFNDAAFKKLLTMPEYQHNVSKADIIFLRPVPYSDI